MFGFRPRNKLSPTLAAELAAPSLSGAVSRPIPVVALCSPAGLKAIRRHHELASSSESLAFAALTLTGAEILRIAQDSEILLLDKDERFASVPQPLSISGPCNADVYARYKTGPLRELNGEGIKVVIQDSGVSPHPDLPPTVRAIDYTGEGTVRDYHGHGTAIVSQIAATGKYPGLIPQAQVLVARIFDKAMSTTVSRILRGCAFALEERAHVVSMSYGGATPNLIISMVMSKLHQSGICLIAAAGNSGPGNGTIEYPGGYDSVLAVAAVNKQGRVAPFSSRGRIGQRPMKPDLALEGVNIVMARSPDGLMGAPVGKAYVMGSGTSFACPIAAGLAAMIIQARGPRIAPAAVFDILRSSARR